jgi:hypothetical protein
MTSKTIEELLEPELRGLPVTGIREAVALSVAISLRRIADAVARPPRKLADQAGWSTTAPPGIIAASPSGARMRGPSWRHDPRRRPGGRRPRVRARHRNLGDGRWRRS